MLAQAEKLETAIGAIEKGSKAASDALGLEAAVNGLQSALRVVEGGDRTTPEQAIEVYRLSDERSQRPHRRVEQVEERRDWPSSIAKYKKPD